MAFNRPNPVTLTKVRAQFIGLGLSESGSAPLAPYELGPNLRWDDGVRGRERRFVRIGW